MGGKYAWLALAVLPAAAPAEDQLSWQAPSQAAASLVNLASGKPQDLALNTLTVLRGKDLANGIRAREEYDAPGGMLPVILPGTGTTVAVNGLLATLEYVSPDAITFLVPPDLPLGPAIITVLRNSQVIAEVKAELLPVAPTLFQLGDGVALARRSGGMNWIREDDAATPGETVTLYATGLGQTSPPQIYRQLPREAAPLDLADPLHVAVAGVELEAREILFAGSVAGLPGVYEIRFRLPLWAPDDPEVEVRAGGRRSQSGLRIPVRRQLSQPVKASARTNE